MVRFLGAALVVATLALPSASPGAMLIYTGELVPEGGGGRTGTGTARVAIDDVALTMRVQVAFSGLSGTTTASHIHGPTTSPGVGNAGVITTTPTFPNFPLGVTAGTYDQTFDLTQASSFNPAFITSSGGLAQARTAFLQAFIEGRTYLNIHTTTFGAGEIRATLVPEPSSVVLAAVGGLGLIGAAARRRRRAGRS